LVNLVKIVKEFVKSYLNYSLKSFGNPVVTHRSLHVRTIDLIFCMALR